MTASDGALTVSDVFRLTVDPVNDRPTLEALLADIVSAEDVAIDFAVPAGTFADIDDDALTLTARLANGNALPGWLSFDGARFTGTPPAHFHGAYDIEVLASDGALAVSDVFRLTISAVNDPPVTFAPLADVAVAEDTAVDILLPANTFADADGDALTLTAKLANGDPLPSWLDFTDGRFTGTPPADYNGAVDIEVTASDGALITSDVFRLTIDPVNDRPTLEAALADAVSPEDMAIDVAIPAGTFADVDGDALTLTARLANGSALPSWLSFDGVRLTGTPPANFHGAYDIEVTASDGSLTVSDVFRLTVAPVNDPPVTLSPIADVAVAEDAAVDILLPAGTFADADGDTLTLTAMLANGNALPDWLSFANGRFTGTPPANFNGIFDIEVTASDGALSTSDVFRLTILAVNDAPTLERTLVDAHGPEDSAIDLAIPSDTFADVDGDALTLTARLANGAALPGWLSFDGTRFTGTPPANFNGFVDLEVIASDGALTVSDVFRLTVDPVNDRPTLATLLADVTSPEDMAIDVTIPAGAFADVDGDAITLTARRADGTALPAWLNFANGHLTGTPPANFHGFLDIEVLASDGTLAIADVFRLTISAVNDPPVLLAPLADAMVAEDHAVDILVPAGSFADADGDALALTARLANGNPLPSWLNLANGRFTGTPPANFNGILDIEVTASDGALTTSDVFRLTILAVNDAPTVTLGLADAHSAEDSAIDLPIPAGTFTDVDGDTLTVTARLASGNALPSWLHFDGTRFTGTPPADFNGFIDLEVFANDGLLATSSTFRLTIDPVNDAPVLTTPLADVSQLDDVAVDIAIPAGAFTDADGDALAYSAALADGGALPSWLQLVNGRLVGTPPANSTLDLAIRITASDGTASASDIFTLSIRPGYYVTTGTEGNDTLTGQDGRKDRLVGLGGNDTLSGLGGSDLLEGGAGNDTLQGGADSDTMYGGAGVDTINSDASDGAVDLIYGEAGNDVLRGGSGDVVDGGADHDSLSVGGNGGTYFGGAGTDSFLVDVGTSGTSIDGGDGSDSLVIWGGTTRLSNVVGIEKVNASATPANRAVVYIDAASANLSAASFDGALDLVAGLATGVSIAAPTTLYNAASTNYSIRLLGAAGNDSLTGSNLADELFGAGGNDILTGGAGNDILTGNAGDDIYRFARGTAQDVVRDSNASGGGGSDRIEFAAGIAPSDVTVWTADGGSDLLISITGTTDRIRLDGVLADSAMQIEQTAFADGTIWSWADLLARAVAAPYGENEYHGSVGADALVGGDGSDIIYGEAGNDTITAKGGADLLHGGDGNDNVVAGDGADTLYGDAGNDTLDGGVGDDILHGGDGDDTMTAETFGEVDQLYGDGGNDTIWGGTLDYVDGGAGNDVLSIRGTSGTFLGGAGDDSFSFGASGTKTNHINGGDGIDSVTFTSVAVGIWTFSNVERLYGTTSTTSRAKVTFDTDVTDLSAAQYQGHFDLIAGNAAGMTIIAPLTLLSAAASSLRLYGAAGGDVLVGSNQADQLFGEGGNDTLTGGAGNDALTGGTGTDIAVYSGSMSSYQLMTSGGSLSLVDLDSSDGDDGTDTLVGIETLLFAGGETMSLTAPIVLDLDGDGAELLAAANSNAAFDMNGDGKLDDTSWVGAGDAILFLDRDRNGTVTNAGEFSFIQDAPNARTDLEGLRAFDTNSDGKLTSADARFGDFRLWHDRNGDGVAAAAEITTLTTSKIAAISLAGSPTSVTAAPGSAVAINLGRFTKSDGTTGELADAAFSYFPGTVAVRRLPIAMVRKAFAKKSDKYRVVANGGELFVSLRKTKGNVDAASGRIGPATILSFGDKRIGMLAPIVLDLDGDGVELRNREDSNAHFDMDGDGSRDHTGWIGKGDGLLVIDRDGDGLITSSAELSFLAEKPDARSDLEALATLDWNGDRKIDSTDLRFGELKVWVDGDLDGITQHGELRSLAELGIASISLAAAANSQTAKPGQNLLIATGTFTMANGTVRSLGDAALAFKPSSPSGTRAADAARLGLEPEAMTRFSALRSGLGGGGLPILMSGDLDPFELFGSTEAAAMAGATVQQASAATEDRRLALIAQDMAAFGGVGQEASLRSDGSREGVRFDYFA